MRRVVTCYGGMPGTGGGEASGVPPDLVFASSWSTNTGSTDAAVRDTDRTRPWQQDDGGTRSVTTSPSGEFPSANCLNMPENSGGQLYMTGLGTPYTPTVAVGDYYTLRYLAVFDNNFEARISCNSPDATQGTQADFSCSLPFTTGTTYELQLTAQVLSGPVARTEVRIYECSNISANAYTRTLVRDTDDFTTPAVDPGDGTLPTFNDYTCITGTRAQLSYQYSSRDLICGYNEPFGGTVHPIWMADWEQGGLYTNQCLVGYNFDTGTDITGDIRVSCFTVCAGQIGNREFPLRKWTTAEESWTP